METKEVLSLAREIVDKDFNQQMVAHNYRFRKVKKLKGGRGRQKLEKFRDEAPNKKERKRLSAILELYDLVWETKIEEMKEIQAEEESKRIMKRLVRGY